MRCPDCEAPPGNLHTPGCDVERCPECGCQRISCRHSIGGMPLPGMKRPLLPWSGTFPGLEDAARLGFWCLDQVAQGKGWVRCEGNTPGARPNLNRLYAEAKWDANARRWVAR